MLYPFYGLSSKGSGRMKSIFNQSKLNLLKDMFIKFFKMEKKTCSCCEEIKDITCFNKHGKYLRSECKACQSKRHKIYSNSEKGKTTIMKYMNDHKEESKNTEKRIKSI